MSSNSISNDHFLSDQIFNQEKIMFVDLTVISIKQTNPFIYDKFPKFYTSSNKIVNILKTRRDIKNPNKLLFYSI